VIADKDYGNRSGVGLRQVTKPDDRV
jgi:hypothetical protein